MTYSFEIPKLSFLKIEKYSFFDGLICDYSDIPRPFHTIALLPKGKGEFLFGKSVVPVEFGDIIFIPMHSTYMSTWDTDSITLSIHFQFEIHTPFPNHHKYKIQKIVSDSDYIKELFEKIYYEYKSNSLNFRVISLFYEIMSNLYPKLIYEKTPLNDEKVKNAINYIDTHYKESFSVDYLAKLCNMSVSHFHLCFKKILGMSAIEYKHKVCIHHAELLLLEGKKTIEEISESVGFNSSIYFREIFKKITGISPREYKKRGIE